LCSAGTAIELGIPEDRWVFPSVLIESSASVPLSCRTEPHRWPAMEVLGRAAADHLGIPLAQVPLVELYSCFPAAVRVQQRELGLPAGGTPTLTGGMAFAGGPFNNFSYQATAAVVAALRDDPDATAALVTTVSGLLTKPALAVWSTRPDPEPLVADLGDQVERGTVRLASIARHAGEGTVVTYTLTTEGSSPTEPRRAFVIADVDQGTRWIGRSDDPALVAVGATGGLIGDRVLIEGDSCRLVTTD
jgi:acetyl-CoA C-acetyltransferase